jgi:sugar (pentulose or hexulose) kinase
VLIGLDAGTSVIKATAFTEAGEVVAVASRPTRTAVPAPGRTEQDLEAIVAAVGEVVREVAAAAASGGRPAPDLLGITAQGDGLWLLDERGRPVRPAILWSDARAAPIVAEWVASGLAERAFRRSGNMVFPGAAAPLLVALEREEPASLARAATAAYCKDAILQRLTGARATDASDASVPFLDVRARRYDPALLDLYGVTARRDLLAPVDPTPRPLRPMTPEGAALTGLAAGTPVAGGLLDLCATMVGAGVHRPGDGMVILGTTLGCGVLLDRVVTDGPAAGMTLCLPEPDRWARVMPAMVGTPSLEWVLALVGAERTELEALLGETAPGAGGAVVLPFFSAAGERAPFVDPAARGQLLGLSLETTRAGAVRAVCEGIAYAVRDCLDAAGLAPAADVFVSGGGVRSLTWRQILADVLQRPLKIARRAEVGARGAALVALAAAGRTVDVDRWTQPDDIVTPRPEHALLYDAGFAFYRDRLAAARGRWSGPVGTA